MAVFCFLAPQLLLMKLPIIGPLLFLPVRCSPHNTSVDFRSPANTNRGQGTCIGMMWNGHLLS